jgi:hypothetical protein
MHNFTATIINGSYMFWVKSSNHQAVNIRNIKGNYIPVVYIELQNNSRLYLYM